MSFISKPYKTTKHWIIPNPSLHLHLKKKQNQSFKKSKINLANREINRNIAHGSTHTRRPSIRGSAGVVASLVMCPHLVDIDVSTCLMSQKDPARCDPRLANSRTFSKHLARGRGEGGGEEMGRGRVRLGRQRGREKEEIG